MKTFLSLIFLFLFLYAPLLKGQEIFSHLQDGDLQKVKAALENEPGLLDSTDHQGNKPIHLAAYFGHPKMVQYLLRVGADANSLNHYQRNPLIFANAGHHVECAKILVDHGTNAKARDDLDRTPLHWTAIEGRAEMADFLIDQGASVHVADADQKTPLHYAAQRGNAGVARSLIESGALVNVVDQHAKTPLFAAAWAGHMEIIRMLVEHGAVMDARYLGAASPLTTAAVADHEEVCRFLVEQGANVDLFCNMHVTPLYPAVYNNNPSLVRFFIKHQAKVNYKDIAGRSPLFIAVRDGYEEVARLLTDAGAEVDIADPATGGNLLHLAAANGRTRIAELLISEGLDMNQRDKRGMTPLDYARRHRHQTCSDFFEDMGAQQGAYHFKGQEDDFSIDSEKEALLVKLRNKTWGIRTKSGFLVFGYREHGMRPANPSLANGYLIQKEFKEVPVYHLDGGLTSNNPLYERQNTFDSLSFICNPHYERYYRQARPFDAKNLVFPAERAPSQLGGIRITTLPAFQPYRKSYLVQSDGLNILWLYRHSDRYLPRIKNTEAIEYLTENDISVDILLVGNTYSDMGPEWISVMEQEYEMAKELDVQAVFPMPECRMGYLFSKERRRKGDGDNIHYAIHPGDRFFYRAGKVWSE